MRVNFWIKAWNDSNVGFHQAAAHPALQRHWPVLESGASVLVPLCGKSLDLLWLEKRGLEVTGVEFIEAAVLAFFRDNSLEWRVSTIDGYHCYHALDRNIQIWLADFIQFAEDYTGPPFDSIYDRAALVALPGDMRGDYVAACKKLLVERPRGLLVSLQYHPETMEGPPFSVTPEEVERLWNGRLMRVEQLDMLSSMPRATAAGVRNLDEYFWVFD